MCKGQGRHLNMSLSLGISLSSGRTKDESFESENPSKRPNFLVLQVFRNEKKMYQLPQAATVHYVRTFHDMMGP